MNWEKIIKDNRPLVITGTINAYSALLAERAGIKAIYLSGGGVANASYGLPDLAMTSREDVLEDVRRIRSASNLPLLVDIDTGWGSALGISRTIKEMISAGASGVHIEDQVTEKRCGHRPNKEIVTCSEMVDRIKAAKDAKTDENFLLMARTDAFALGGLQEVIDRSNAFIEAGAEAIFPEAISSLKDYEEISKNVSKPVLANITEFGMTPLFSHNELADAGVEIVLHPLSAFRAMSKAAEKVYATLASDGDHEGLIQNMQTRDELYDVLDYHMYEEKIDKLFEKN